MPRDLHQDLTKKYSSLFEGKGVKNVISFVQDVFLSGKLREIVSFAVWEIAHRLKLFRRDDYLVFTNQDSIVLGTDGIADALFKKKVEQFFTGRHLQPTSIQHNWKLIFQHTNGDLFGSIYPEDNDLYQSADGGKSILLLWHFPEQIKSIFVSSHGSILVCVKGAIYLSSDGGNTFEKVLELSSPISFLRYNNSITETPDGCLYFGEYGNFYDKNGWRKMAFLYASIDDGKIWAKSDFLIKKGANKHVHLVRYSHGLNRLLVTDGDNFKRLWISNPLDAFRFESPEFRLVNRFHIQMGGYTSVVESDGKIIFGTDYQGGTNFLVETTNGWDFKKKLIPDPFRRSPIDNMLVRKSIHGNEIWANLPFSTAKSRCLLMVSRDGGVSWEKVFEYNRSDYTVWLISSSADPSDEIVLSVEWMKNHDRLVYKIGDKVETENT